MVTKNHNKGLTKKGYFSIMKAVYNTIMRQITISFDMAVDYIFFDNRAIRQRF